MNGFARPPSDGLRTNEGASEATARYGPAIALLAGGAFAARTLTLTQQSLWLDEVDAAAFAGQDIGALLVMMVSPAQNGGLFYLMLKGWLSLAGVSEFTLRYASVLPSVLVIPLMYVMGRRLLSPEAGFWAALLAASSPYLFFYAQEAKMYALYAALAVLAMHLFLTALERGDLWRWSAYLATTVVGLYTHLFFIFLLMAQHLMALVLWRRYRAGVRRWYLLQAALILPAVPLALWAVPAALLGYATSFDPQPLGTMLRVLVLRFTLHTEVWPSPFVLLPFGAAFAAAFLLGQPEASQQADTEAIGPPVLSPEATRLRAGRLVLLLWLTVPVAGYYLVSFQVPAFMHRYFTLVVPAYYLALGTGLAALCWRWPLIGLLCAAGIVGAWGAMIVRPAEVRPDFRSAAQFVTMQAQDGDSVLFATAYGSRAFAFYAPGHPPGLNAPYTNDSRAAAEVERDLALQTALYQRVWLILFEDWLWDNRQITRGWLERNGTLVETGTYSGVTALAYRFNR